MARIHWCGAGLSAVPGIRRLIENGRGVTVWNRTLAKAEEATAGLNGEFECRVFDHEALRGALAPGDVVVSMLPGDWHAPLAQTCIAANARFVSSSYISPEMRALHDEAYGKGLALVNEVGLDPGLDHSMAHDLVASYKASPLYDPANEVSFYSYCGGLSATPNDFRYKFSWSPLGVLKALRSPSRSLKDGATYDVARPWDAIGDYALDLPGGREVFEVYPNRDSLSFMEDYRFGDDWNVKDFVRGTLRYGGWSTAWADIFAEVETLKGEAGDARLAEMSAEMWDKYAFQEGEFDRVVLTVELAARTKSGEEWRQAWRMDAYGDAEATAMARLVSIPVSLAVEAVLDGEIGAGVSAAPSSPELVERWLAAARAASAYLEKVDLS